MENLSIRKVEEADNKPLATLIRDVFDEFNAPHQHTVYSDPATNDLYTLFQKPRSVLWVAELDNKILGCCGIYHTEGLTDDCAELAKFYLFKEARGKGVGKKLMLMCFQSAKEMRYKKLYIESLPQFSQAVSMYEKYEFKKLDKPLGNSGHASCNIWMLKELSALS
ncbi:MAG TPA: GNAT family N-acetyltransferase [Parafilimonas sp.]|jgi:putative acetyltransferase